MNLKEKAAKLKTDIPALVLALKDSDTPIIAKVFACLTVVLFNSDNINMGFGNRVSCDGVCVVDFIL